MTKFLIQVFFLQNTLVEYIGVYSDTNYLGQFEFLNPVVFYIFHRCMNYEFSCIVL